MIDVIHELKDHKALLAELAKRTPWGNRPWASHAGPLELRRSDGKVLAIYDSHEAAERGLLRQALSPGFDPTRFTAPPLVPARAVAVWDHGKLVGTFDTHGEADRATEKHLAEKLAGQERTLRPRYRRFPEAPPAAPKAVALPQHEHEWEPVTPESLARAGVHTASPLKNATSMRLCVACRTVELKLPEPTEPSGPPLPAASGLEAIVVDTTPPPVAEERADVSGVEGAAAPVEVEGEKPSVVDSEEEVSVELKGALEQATDASHEGLPRKTDGDAT